MDQRDRQEIDEIASCGIPADYEVELTQAARDLQAVLRASWSLGPRRIMQSGLTMAATATATSIAVSTDDSADAAKKREGLERYAKIAVEIVTKVAATLGYKWVIEEGDKLKDLLLP